MQEPTTHCAWLADWQWEFSTAIFVLHAFQKAAQHTWKRDIDVAAERFKQITKGQRK